MHINSAHKAIFFYGENKIQIEKQINDLKQINASFYKFESKSLGDNLGLLIDRICAKNLFIEQEVILIENVNNKQLVLILEILEKYLEQSHNLVIITLDDSVKRSQLNINNPHINIILCHDENKDEKIAVIEKLIAEHGLNLNLKQKNFISKILYKENIIFIEQEIKKLSLLLHDQLSISNREIVNSLDLKPNYYINNMIENILAQNNDYYQNLHMIVKQYPALVILKIITSYFVKFTEFKKISHLQIAQILKISLEYELQMKIDNQRGEFLIIKFLYDVQNLCN